MTISLGLYANPFGGSVSSGQVQISNPNSSTLLINQTTQKGIINWQSFNIAPGETTQFIQPNSSAITLNRVNGLGGPSSIFGNLMANGQVWIINPAGIVFGKGAHVNVGGLLATTSNITDEDFLSGNYKFTSNSNFSNASVINNGTIQVQPGGLVALIGNSVHNNGVIQAKMGTVILGGAQAYTLDFDGDQLINFQITKGVAKKGMITNSGVIDVGQGAVMTPKSAQRLVQNTINMSGVSEATHVSSKGGVIILDAGGGKVGVKGKLIAKNGNIILKGKSIKTHNAKIDTSGDEGGNIVFLSSGKVNLKNTQLSANSLSKGGTITLLGKDIALNSSHLEANGNTGGGTILIGGNAHGAGSEMHASHTTMSSDSSISADALINGNGGKIVLWSDDGTQAYGSISAKGGILGGDGGFIETSGGHLDIAGININLLAPQGKTGLWLLDPSNITINNGTTDMVLAGDIYSPLPAADTSILNVNDLITQLGSANIEVVTTSTGTGSGNITLATALTWNSPNTLTLTADPITGQVNINSAVTANGLGAGLILSGNTISITAPITTNNGNVSFTGATTLGATINTGTGSQTYNSPVTLSSSSPLTGGTFTFSTINVPSGQLLTITNSNLSNITGQISSGATGGIIKAGSGTLILSAAASPFLGNITINGGTLAMGIANALNSNVAIIFSNIAGAALDLQNFNLTVGSISGGGTVGGNINLGSGTLTFGGNNTTTSFGGAISGIGGGLTKEGTNQITFSGLYNSTYTGPTLINAGTINMGPATGFGTSGATGTSSITVASGSTLTLSFDGTLANTTAPIFLNGTGTSGNGALTTGVVTPTLANPITLNGNTTINSPFNTLTLSGTITDGGSNFRLTKIGNATLNLTGANSYTGGTTLSAGTLIARNINALGTTGTINVSGNLRFNLSGGTLQNASLITMNSGSSLGDVGTGIFTDTLNNPFLLNTNISISLTSSGATFQLLGNISGTGGINLSTPGSVVLSGTNSYTGPTTIGTAAILILTNPFALGDATGGLITIGAGTLSMNLGGATLANTSTISTTGTGSSSIISTVASGLTDTLSNNIVMGSSGTFLTSTNSGATFALTGGITMNASNFTVSGSGNTTISGILSGGPGTLVKTNPGTLTLSNANTYTGPTSISGGILRANNADALGAALGTNTITIAGSTLDLNFNGTLTNTSNIIGGSAGILLASGTNLTVGNSIVTSGTGSFTINVSNPGALLLYNGNISNGLFGINLTGAGNINVNGVIGSGSGGITKSGTGTATLNNTNTYTGNTVINAGTLAMGVTNAIGTGSAVTLANVATAILNLQNFNTTIGSLAGGGGLGGNVVLGSATLTTGGNNTTTNYSGIISGSGGLTKVGSGTMTLLNVNTYTGATNINGGSLTLGVLNALNSATAVSLANVSGAIFNLQGFATTIASLSGGGNLGGNVSLASTLTVGDTNSTLYSGVISGSGSLTKVGSGTLTLAGPNTYTGATTINAGTLALGANNSTSSSSAVTLANVAGATLDLQNFNTAIGSLAGGGNLGGNVNLGSGTLTTGGNNNTTTYSGVISGSGGLTKVGGTGTMILTGVNTYSGATNILAGTLRLGTTNSIISSAVILANVSNAVLNLTNNNAIASLSGGGNLGGNVTLGTSTLTTGSDNTSTTYSGVISGTGGLTKVGSGTMTISGLNTYSGATTINAGTLALGINNGISSSSNVTLANVAGATFDLQTFNDTIGSLAGGGPLGGNVIIGGGTLSTGNATTTTYSGNISGGGNLIKLGSGSMTLAGANTYTGTTSVNAGTLNVTNTNGLGSSSGGTISVANSATLGINLSGNTLANNKTISLSGSIVEGGSADTLNNPITLGGNASIGGTGSLVLNGNINGAFALTIQGLSGITLGGLVGNTSPLASLSATVPVISASSVTTTGSQSYTGSTSTTLNGGYLTSGGTFAVTGPTLLGGTVSIDTTNGGAVPAGANITFSSTINNNQALTIASGNGSINFNNVIGGIQPLASLTATNTGATNDLTLANNINTLGALQLTAGRNLNISTGNLTSSSGNISLTGTTGLVQETSTGKISGSLLTTQSAQGTTLNSANTVTSFNGTNTSSGNISLTNTSAPLTITGISQTGGDINITNTGAINTIGALSTAGGGNISLTATDGSATIGAPVTAGGSGGITFNATGASSDITINDAVSSTSGTVLAIAGHDLILGTSGSVAGGPITLVANNAFINNNSSALAIQPSSGNRFLVYSVDPANDIRGNVAYSFKQYNAVYNVTPVLGTGNGFLYTIAPVATPVLVGNVIKPYDGTLAATLAASNYSTTGAIDGDTITLNNPVSGTYASANVGTNINVSVSGISIAGASNGSVTVYGYTLSSSSANANIGTITPASLTISPTAGQSKTYGTNDPASGFTFSETGLIAGDSITGNLGRAAGENVGNYAYNQGNLDAGTNYSITINPDSFAITPTNLVITPTSGQTKIYGQNDPAPGLTYSSSGLVSGVAPLYWNSSGQYVNAAIINDGISGNLGRASGENVGNYGYTLGSVTAGSNYNTSLNAGTFAITPASLTLTPSVGLTKVYGTNDPALGFTYSNTGLITGVAPLYWNSSGQYVNAATINDSISGNLGRASGENVGNYGYTLGSVTAGSNYNTSFNAGTFAITPAPITADIANQIKVYGTNDPTIASIVVNLDGIVNTIVQAWNSSGQYVFQPPINDTGNVSSTLLSLVRMSGESVIGSPYNITSATFTPLSGSAAGNYSGPNYVSASSSLSILPTNLTIDANNASKVVGTPDPPFTYSEVGLITNGFVTNWMNVTVPINDSISGSLSRAPGNLPGDYPITLGSLSAGSNYQINYNGAILTIEPNTPPPSPPIPNPPESQNIPDNIGVIIYGILPTDYDLITVDNDLDISNDYFYKKKKFRKGLNNDLIITVKGRKAKSSFISVIKNNALYSVKLSYADAINNNSLFNHYEFQINSDLKAFAGIRNSASSSIDQYQIIAKNI